MGGLVFSSGICNGHFGTLIWTRVRRGNHYLCLNQAVFLKGRNLHPNLVVIMVNPCTFFLLCNWCSIIIIVAGATTIIWRSKLSQIKKQGSHLLWKCRNCLFSDMLPWKNTEYFNYVLWYATNYILKWVLFISRTVYTLQINKNEPRNIRI